MSSVSQSLTLTLVHNCMRPPTSRLQSIAMMMIWRRDSVLAIAQLFLVFCFFCASTQYQYLKRPSPRDACCISLKCAMPSVSLFKLVWSCNKVGTMKRWSIFRRRLSQSSGVTPAASSRVSTSSSPLPPPPTPAVRPQQMSRFLQLPTELVMRIINWLDWRTLLACSEVCAALHDAIASSAECQYTIELAIAGMEDGPPSNILLAERLQRLREYKTAWHSLKWRTDKSIDMLDGGVWELYGGVLAHARRRDTLVFDRLPSQIRGIAEEQWEVTPRHLTSIRDFAMEPACELLVLIETAMSDGTYNVHLRSMRTGESHKLACNPAVLTHKPEGIHFSFAIQISGDYIGILFISSDEHDSQLVIWNWHTGEREIALKGQTIGSFGFLDEEHILIGVVQQPEPSLQVVNFKKASGDLLDIESAPFEYALLWPSLQVWAAALAISVRSDPSPGWQPQSNHNVPFYTARNDRLFAITLWVAEGANIYTLLLFVPFSTVKSRMQSSTTPGREFAWAEWGPEGSRMMKAPSGHSMIWVCYIFGQSFIAPRHTVEYDQHPVGPKAVQIFDFNQLAIQRELARGTKDETSVTTVIKHPTELTLGSIFREPVTTHLPYRLKVTRVPLQGSYAFNAVMLSEDSIVTVTSNPNVRQYRILSF